MKVTYRTTPKKINKMFNKVKKDSGTSKHDAFTFVGECMEYGDVIFTEGDMVSTMHDVLEEAMKALKSNPEAQEVLKKHFGMS